MAPRKEFDISGRIVTIHLQSRQETLRVHYDLIKDYYMYSNPGFEDYYRSAGFSYLKIPDRKKPDELIPHDKYDIDDDTIVTLVRWLYTGAVESSTSYFSTVADVLRIAFITSYETETGMFDFHNALIDHAIGMTLDTTRGLNLVDSISAMLFYDLEESPGFDPKHGVGRFLVDWVVHGGWKLHDDPAVNDGCADNVVASVFEDIKSKVRREEDFEKAIALADSQHAIVMALLEQKAEEWQDEGILPWNNDPCRYHEDCTAEACRAYREQLEKGHGKAPGIAYHCRAPKNGASKRKNDSGSEGEDEELPSKKRLKKNATRAENGQEDDDFT